MKKLKLLAVIGCTICACVTLVSCGKAELETPRGFDLTDDYALTWNAVKGALTYELEITDEEGVVSYAKENRPNCQLTDIIKEVGDYEIRIRAIANERKNKNSDWSAVIPFQKAYESGCLFELLNNAEYQLIRGVGEGDIVLESEFRKKPVTKIGDGAFKGMKAMTSIKLGDYVTEIGENAFYNCSAMTSFDWGNADVQSIGKSAFEYCKALPSIEIPEDITAIREYTFAYCRALTEIDWNGAPIVTIEKSAFSDCSALPSVVIPDTVVEIGTFAFAANEELQSLTIGKSVTTLGESVFYKCIKLDDVQFVQDCALKELTPFTFADCKALATITLPEGLTVISHKVFENAELLDNVTIPVTVREIGTDAFYNTRLYNKQAANDYIYVGTGNDWLIGCSVKVLETLKTLTDTTLKSGVVGIASGVFSNAAELGEISFADSIRYLGDYAFMNNYKLTTMQTNKVEFIGESAFQGCKFLSYVLFGKLNSSVVTLKEIDSYAFYGCSALIPPTFNEDKWIPDTVERIGTFAFRRTGIAADEYGVLYAGNWLVGYDSLQEDTIEIKPGTRGIADYAFYKCDELVNLNGMGRPQIIGRAAFYMCSKLSSITLNNNITEIKDYTFYKCSSVYTAKLPARLEKIGRSAFYKCEVLEEVNLSMTVTEDIGPYAFYGCKDMKTLNLGYKVKDIGYYAFFDCDNLSKVKFPATIKNIGRKAFAKCDKLKTVEFTAPTMTQDFENWVTVGDYAFQACEALKTVTLSNAVKTVGAYAFYKCYDLEDITFGANVKTVGDYAFFGDVKLDSLVLPASLQEVGSYAFKGCVGLDSILLPETIHHMGDHAVYGCTSATIYTNADKPSDVAWNERWNSSFRPIVWGCTLSQDGTYVVSVTVTEHTFDYGRATGGFTAPTRAGYTFLGWKDASGNLIAASEVESVPVGTTLTAEWAEV